MRTGSRFRRYLFLVSPMPSFRLRHVLVTPSARLRARSSKALGFSNLLCDFPLDSGHFGCCYLNSTGALNSSSTLASLAAFGVVRLNSVRGLLLDVASSGQATPHDRIARCCLERRDNQLTVNFVVHDFLQQWSTTVREDEQCVSKACSATPINARWWSYQEPCVRDDRKGINYAAKSWSNKI